VDCFVFLHSFPTALHFQQLLLQGKARLGAIVHQKNAAALAVTGVKNEDQREFGKLVESFKSQFNEGARVQWGGGIMGIKSQHKQKQKERILAKELAQRMTV
jgi:large subunit ribosomal protein L7Ae